MTKRRDSAEWVRDDIANRGAKIAYEALLAIAQDTSAPAPARATAGVAILRSGGLLDGKKPERDADASEMVGPEWEARLREVVRSQEIELAELLDSRARRQASGAEGPEEDDDDADEPSVFD